MMAHAERVRHPDGEPPFMLGLAPGVGAIAAASEGATVAVCLPAPNGPSDPVQPSSWWGRRRNAGWFGAGALVFVTGVLVALAVVAWGTTPQTER